MNVHYISKDELDELAKSIKQRDRETDSRLVWKFLRRLQSQGATHLTRQLHSQRPDFADKKAVIEHLGLPLLQAKQAFVWREPRPPMQVPDRLIFRSFAQVGKEVFVEAIVTCHHETLDRAVKSLIAEQKLQKEGLTQFIDKELDEVGEDFVFESDWWQLAYTDDGKLVGYVQPALIRGMNRGELGEGTIYYIGVVPEARGNGYVHDLLAKGIAILQHVGVWQIYVDTDCENHPMIHACKAAGFTEEGINYIWQGRLERLMS